MKRINTQKLILTNIQSKKLWFIEVYTDYSFHENDFYEPRTPGWYFKRGASIGLGALVRKQ